MNPFGHARQDLDALASVQDREHGHRRSTANQLHGDEGLAVFFTHLVDLADIGVVDSRLEPCLLREARPLHITLTQHQLDREMPFQSRIIGLVNLTHATRTQQM